MDRENRCSNKLKSLDIFSQEIEILFENDQRTLKTHCGVLAGLIMVMILVTFGGYKTNLMINY